MSLHSYAGTIDNTGLPDWLGYIVVSLAVLGVALTFPWSLIVLALILLMAGGIK